MAVLGMTLAEWERQREAERKRKAEEEAKAEKRANTEKRKSQKQAETAVRERWAEEAAEKEYLEAYNAHMAKKMDRIDAEDEAEYNRVQSVLAQRARQDANNAHMQTKMADVDAADEAAWEHSPRPVTQEEPSSKGTLLEKVWNWVTSPATWWDTSTEDETIKILKEADDIPLNLPLIKGINPQLPNIKAPAWYLEKYGVKSIDDLAGPLKTILVNGKTIRALGRTAGDITLPWTLGIGLGLTVTPNLITNIRDRKPWNDTVADLIIDTSGFVVSELAGIGAGIGINIVAPGLGTLSTLGTKLVADAGTSVAWDTMAEENNWSEKLSSWLDQTAQNFAGYLGNSFTNALDVNTYPPIPTPPSVTQPITTPSTSSPNPEVIPTHNPLPSPASISTPTPPPP